MVLAHDEHERTRIQEIRPSDLEIQSMEAPRARHPLLGSCLRRARRDCSMAWYHHASLGSRIRDAIWCRCWYWRHICILRILGRTWIRGLSMSRWSGWLMHPPDAETWIPWILETHSGSLCPTRSSCVAVSPTSRPKTAPTKT